MSGIYIVPEARYFSIPGQIPGLEPDLAVGPPMLLDMDVGIVDPGPVTSIESVMQNLGLDSGQEGFVRSLLSRALNAGNEVTFRQELMQSLYEERVPATLRRALLTRAVTLYRGLRPSPKGPDSDSARLVRLRKPARDVELHVSDELDPDYSGGVIKGGVGDGAHLRSALRRLLEQGGELGVPTKKLADLIRKHGSQAVASGMRELGVHHNNQRIYLDSASKKVQKGSVSPISPMSALFVKAEIEQMPAGGAGAGGSPGVDDPRSAPVGSRKIWNKRIVEKKPDGKWHVVGHVNGLEDPKAVPQLDTSMLTREHLLHLLQQLVKIHEAHNGKPVSPASSESSKRDVVNSGAKGES